MIDQPVGLQEPSGSPREAPAKNLSAGQRAALFQETPFAIVQRWILGTAWALRPKRIASLLTVARISTAHLVNPSRALPDTATLALDEEIAGLVTDLSPPTLMDAYANGLFPYGHIRPLK